jgi:hypothetical protein
MMNNPIMPPERAWDTIVGQLQLEMQKAAFDTWVRDTSFVGFDGKVFQVGVHNVYTREWLTSRLKKMATRLLTGIMNQAVELQFVVLEDFSQNEIEPEMVSQQETAQPDILALEARYRSIYEELVQPERVIVFRGYFLRYLPWFGFELAWIYIGFRQAAFEAGGASLPVKKVSVPARKVASYAGMSLRTFRRWMAKPETWSGCAGWSNP